MPCAEYNEESGLGDLDLDDMIRILLRIRRHVKGKVKVRYADGRDNAFGVACIGLEKNAGWEGEPEDEVYVALS